MNAAMKKSMVWAPRILGILLAAFVTVFALDVFQEGLGLGQTLAALGVHLIPTAFILGALAIAWRRPSAGGVLFVGLGVWYLATARDLFPWATLALMSGWPMLAGVLFLASGFLRAQGEPGTQS